MGNAITNLTTTFLVPIITIVGLIVLLALHDIDQTAGLTLIAALSGAHAGSVLTGKTAITTSTATPPGPVL